MVDKTTDASYSGKGHSSSKTSVSNRGPFSEADENMKKGIARNEKATIASQSHTEDNTTRTDASSTDTDENTDKVFSPGEYVVSKHQDTPWEAFKNKFPSYGDDEYKRFNPYDIVIDGLEKIANSGKGIDDMFLDFLLLVVCMPLDQAKAVFDYNRRKRLEKKSGRKAGKDFDKMRMLQELGLKIDAKTEEKITLDKVQKDLGWDIKKSPEFQKLEEAKELVQKTQKGETLTAEESAKVGQVAKDFNLDELSDAFMADASEQVFSPEGDKALADKLGIQATGNPQDTLKKFFAGCKNNPEAKKILSKSLAQKADDYLDKQLTEVEGCVRAMGEAIKLGKKGKYSEEQLAGLLEKFGYDSEKTKKDGMLTFDVVYKTLLKEKKQIEADMRIYGLSGKSSQSNGKKLSPAQNYRKRNCNSGNSM